MTFKEEMKNWLGYINGCRQARKDLDHLIKNWQGGLYIQGQLTMLLCEMDQELREHINSYDWKMSAAIAKGVER